MAFEAAAPAGGDVTPRPASWWRDWLGDARPLLPPGLWRLWLAFTALSLARTGPAAWRTIWAEDGTVFLADALAGTAGALTPYAGYFQVFPRLVAAAVAPAPPAAWPMLLALAGAAVAGLAATLTWYHSDQWLRHASSRAILATAVVLAPMAGPGMHNNVAYAHWFLVYAAFWALQSQPTGPRDATGRTVLLVVAALSSSVALLLVPLAAAAAAAAVAGGPGGGVAAWWRRAPAAAFAVAGVAQLLVGDGFAWSSDGLVIGLLTRGAGSVLGPLPIMAAWRVAPALAIVWSGGAWIALAAIAARQPGAARWRALSIRALATALFLVPVAARGVGEAMRWRGTLHLDGARYTVLPFWLLLLILLLGIESLRPRWRRAATPTLVALLLAGLVLMTASGGQRDGDFHAAWDGASCVGGVREVATSPAGWSMATPCQSTEPTSASKPPPSATAAREPPQPRYSSSSSSR